MKKTLTANISGTVFHIEEDAYETLQRYLANIRSQFAGTDGRDDIMSDIEARIAELFTERMDAKRQVVSLTDVEHVMAVMGQPEDFADGEPAASSSNTAQEQAPPQERGPKRFFRDTEDKWLGGVLGGLAAYIGMDALWLRIGMIALVMASVGVLIPIYILLWILVPKADSAADRLQMRGEAVTVENIKRVVEEGAERMKIGGERFASEARDLGNSWRSGAARNKSRAAEIIAKLIGIAFLVLAFSLLMGLITGMVGGTVSLWHATWASEETGILDLGELLFTSRSMALWCAIGVFTLLVVPVIGLFLAGFRLLLNTRTPRWLGLSLIVIWIAAFIPTIWGAVEMANDFKRENSVITEVELVQPVAGTLYLDALSPADSTGEWSIRLDNGELDVDLDGLHLENGTVFGAWAQLDVETSADSLFHLKVQREAHGRSAKAALARAQDISYNVKQEGDVLLASPVVRYAASDKLRGQDVQFTLEVPLAKSVFFRPGSVDVIYDIDNVTNTLDSEMMGRTWTMTPSGLMDPNAPLKKGDDDHTPLPTPTDTIKVSVPIAAVVWPGRSKVKPATQPRQTPVTPRAATTGSGTTTTTETRHASLMPNLLGLLLSRLH